MIPEPTVEDTREVHARYRKIAEGRSKGIRGDRYYGYQGDLYEIVLTNLRRFGIDLEAQAVTLIKGLVQDTMKIEEPVALAHIDVDWYAPVLTCLRRIFPSLVVGGSIILDDYHSWGGCRRAADEFLREIEGQFELDDEAGSLGIIKVELPAPNRVDRTSYDV
jgi:asparagine synthase (glutamine-hydrolysing)